MQIKGDKFNKKMTKEWKISITLKVNPVCLSVYPTKSCNCMHRPVYFHKEGEHVETMKENTWKAAEDETGC